MRPLSERKQRTIDFVCKALELLEGDTHVNAERYRKLWENMTDKEFTKMMETLRANPMTKQIAYFEVIEFERDLKLHNIEATADFMKVPLYEYVVVTPEPVPVGYAHYKRMPQTVLKKSSVKVSYRKRNPITGQPTSQEKTARNTDVETYALSALGATNALRELLGPSADDPAMENEMMQKIASDGAVSLSQLTSDRKNKTALNTLNTYFLMQMFTTNLLGPLGVLPQPVEKK